MLLLLTGIALAARPAPTERTLPVEMPTLRVENASGLTRVRVDADAAQSKVTVRPGLFWAEDCALTFTGDRQHAAMQVQRGGERAGLRCRARVEVVLAGPTRLELDTRMGRIKARELEQLASAHVGFGTIDLRYAEAPVGVVAADVGVGRARVHFPYGTWLDLETDTVVGHVSTEIPNREDALTELDARAGLGGVGVRTVLIPWEEVRLPAEPPPPVDAVAQTE